MNALTEESVKIRQTEFSQISLNFEKKNKRQLI